MRLRRKTLSTQAKCIVLKYELVRRNPSVRFSRGIRTVEQARFRFRSFRDETIERRRLRSEPDLWRWRCEYMFGACPVQPMESNAVNSQRRPPGSKPANLFEDANSEFGGQRQGGIVLCK